MTLPPLLTKQDLARHYECSIRTIERWRRAGKLPPPILLGGKIPRWEPEKIWATEILSREKRRGNCREMSLPPGPENPAFSGRERKFRPEKGGGKSGAQARTAGQPENRAENPRGKNAPGNPARKGAGRHAGPAQPAGIVA